MAAVGRKNGSVGRPAVSLSASVAPTTSSPMRISTLSRCQRPGPEAPDPGQQHQDDQDREQQPATEARDVGRVWRRPSASIFSMSVAVEWRPVADDDLALADRDQNGGHLRGRGRPCGRGQRLAERGVRDDQRRDELGREHPFRLVEAARHPAGQARLRLVDLGVAQLGAQRRVEDARRLGPDDRPAGGVETDERRLRRLGQVRDRGLRAATSAPPRADIGRERRVDADDARPRRRAAGPRRSRSRSRS